VSLLTSKNEELYRQLENRPYYTAYEEITREVRLFWRIGSVDVGIIDKEFEGRI